jgi:pilus assembly protein Flp/PilA
VHAAVRERIFAVIDRVTADQGGQGLVEYALILLLVSVVSIAILTILGTDVRNVFSSVVNAL